MSPGRYTKMSVNFCKPFLPTTQKALFHKTRVADIRRWLAGLEKMEDNKQILLVDGPVGCGKSKTLELLLRNYTVFSIDPSDIRSTEKVTELLDGIPGYRDLTLANISKMSNDHTDAKFHKRNVLVVDNIELCEKTIMYFVESVHTRRRINIPIILLTNVQKYKDLFSEMRDLTFLRFTKATDEELVELIKTVAKREGFRMISTDIKRLITTVEGDIRQIYHLLEGFKYSKLSFLEYIDATQIKHVDTDLTDKLSYVFDKKKPYDFKEILHVVSSEPIGVSAGIFQNYLSCNKHMDIDRISTIADTISDSNMIQNAIYEEQAWELYDTYCANACVIPTYYLKRDDDVEYDDEHELVAFKDFSYNYVNSYSDIQKLSFDDTNNSKSHQIQSNSVLGLTTKKSDCFNIASIFLSQLTRVTHYFDSNKRGKNTSKREKLDICDNIKDDNIKGLLDSLTNRIYYYKLYEMDTDHIRNNIKRYRDTDYLKNNIEKINLRIFKRYINIFTMKESSKSIKSHVECAIKYKLLQKMVEALSETPPGPETASTPTTHTLSESASSATNTARIENLITDLSSIWRI
jgi:DNA polymerase III delta prime subunit